MAEEKIIYGRITCPHCHFVDGMRITADKNGQPFGFCDANCRGQLKIGGDAFRVNKFYQAHPAIANAMKGEPVTELPKSTEPENEPEKPVTVTGKNSGFSLDQL